MKNLPVLILTGLLVFTTSAFAKLGENREQIAKRYGPGTRSDLQRFDGAETMKYNYDNFEIEVVFHDDKSMWEIFHPTRDVTMLLKAYVGDGRAWHYDAVTRNWLLSGNPKYIAYVWPGHEDYFCIQDAKAIETIQDGNVNGTGGF